MKISVVIPVFNVEKYLSECLESVLTQTYQNIEPVLVDDGSTDTSGALCDEFAGKDDRIKVIHKTNGGLAEARNTGLKYATGQYVMFLDADDFWNDREAIAKIAARISCTNPDVLSFLYNKYYEETNQMIPFGRADSMPEELLTTQEQLAFLNLHSLYIASACNKVIRTDLLRANDLVFKAGRVSEDIEWCARLMAAARRFDYVNMAFYCYRQRSTSITHSFSAKSCKDLVYNVRECIKTARTADAAVKQSLYQYSAYQFATFFAVQALAEDCPQSCYIRMGRLCGILRYHGNNKKVRILYLMNKVLGFEKLCLIIRKTRKIWG